MGVKHIAGQGKRAGKIGHSVRAENKLHPAFEMRPIIRSELCVGFFCVCLTYPVGQVDSLVY